jgi:predicted ribosomally synthesized peptide with SipW-like signal peptide
MKKIGFIVLAVILALGLIGAAYAAWSQIINVNGTVSTGNIQPLFENADVTGTYNGVAYSVTGNGTTALTLTLNYAYPGWTGTFDFDIENGGTAPIGSLNYGSVVVSPYPADITVNNGTLPATPIAAGVDVSGGSFMVTINGTAVQNGVYTVTIPITAATGP